MAELTPENFVSRIKAMAPRERGKLLKDDLINLILQLSELSAPSLESFNALSIKVEGLVNTCSFFQSQVVDNSASLRNLEKINDSLSAQNKILCEQMKVGNKEINNVNQYLRVDNNEVVGLPTTGENEHDEDLLLDCVNAMNLDREPLEKKDIDICHQIPTRRKDQKRIVICKFMLRKSKIAVLSAKKNQRNLQYRGSLIFINEHLSPNNRKLFNMASQLKHELNFKFLWTKNGSVFLRKHDGLEVIEVNDEEVISQLRDNNIQSPARPME